MRVEAVLERLFASGDPFVSWPRVRHASLRVGRSSPDPYRPFFHPDLPGYALLAMVGEARPDRDIKWVKRLIQQRQEIAEQGCPLWIAPKVWPVWQEEYGRYLLVSEWPGLLSAEENLERYRALGQEQIEALVAALVELRPFRLSPERLQFTREGSLFWEGRLRMTHLMTDFRSGFADYLAPDLCRFACEVAYDRLKERIKADRVVENPFPDLEEYLLPDDSEVKGELDQLFVDPVDFIDRDSMGEIGFTAGERWGHWGGQLFMVVGHPSLPHHLIKATPFVGDTVDHYTTRLNFFLRRIRHARALADYIARHKMDRVVVARKWLYRLPPQFNDRLTPYGRVCMVVDRFDLLDRRTCHQKYRELDRESVRQLVELWVCVGNFEGFLQNIPLTIDGKIALIDTERGSGRLELVSKSFLDHLTPEMAEYARSVAQELRG